MSDDIKKADAEQTKADAKTEQKSDKPKTYEESYVKELIAERDEAKKKARLYEEEQRKIADEKKKVEEQKAIEDGKAKQILEQKELELAALRQFKADAEKVEAEEKSRLLERIEDEGLRKVYSTLSASDIRMIIEKQNETKAKLDKGKYPTTGLLTGQQPKDFKSWEMELQSKGMAK